MNLDFFNNLINSTKENNVIQSFIKELGEFLEKNIGNSERNEESLVQKLLDGRTLTTRYRDKINVQRHKIITNYSRENAEQGEFYYVYGKGSDNTYGVVMHKNEECGSDIWVKESQLPKEAGVDSVLRVKNGKFILDKDATEKLQTELTEMINKLLEEQSERSKDLRVEGHLYEFVEKSGDTVWLIDETDNKEGCFQEIEFPSELLDEATQGTIFQYVNGEYKLYR